MKHYLKRLTALVLALSMAMSLLCTGAWAAEAETETGDVSIVQEETPVAQEEAPAEEPETPAEEPEAPAQEEESPKEEEDAPAEEEAPKEEEETPTQEETPAEEEEPPAEEPESPAEETAEEEEAPEAEEAEEELMQTSTSGVDGNITWTLNNGVLTLSGNGKMNDYSSYSSTPWYNYRNEITSIVVESGVTSIGNYAFGGYISSSYAYAYLFLTNVSLPSSVTSIGNYAFEYCVSLTTVSGSNKVKTIGSYAFQQCISLDSINLSAATSIGSNAFLYCEKLPSLKLASGTKEIQYHAFYGCTSMKTLTIPNSVTYISGNAYGFTNNDDNSAAVKISGAKVIGAVGSKAQTYAKDYGLSFQANGIVVAPKVNKDTTSTGKGLKLSWKKVDGATSYTVYSGGKVLKDVTGTSYVDTRAKSNGKKYTYKVTANVKVGGKLKRGKKSDLITGYYMKGISLGKVTNVKGKKIQMKWGKNAKATGYEIYISTSKKFPANKNTGTVRFYSAKTLKGLIGSGSYKLGKKTYYVKIRAFKRAGSTYHYSAWSKTKTIKIKK